MEQAETGDTAMTRHKVIFDTDPGVDDAMALLYIDRCGALDLLGVTTVLGNADIDVVTRNALYLKQRFGLKAPVARGAEKPLKRPRTDSPTHIHGHNGIGDAPVPDKLDVTEDPRPAWQFIIDTVRAHPGEVTLIAVGRMTNLALALQNDPGIAKLVKAVSIMGGAFGINGHSGNVSPVAEANIIGDPEAADQVVTADWPVTMIGLDVTHETIMTTEYLQTMQAKGGEIGQFFWDITRGYEKFYKETGRDERYRLPRFAGCRLCRRSEPVHHARRSDPRHHRGLGIGPDDPEIPEPQIPYRRMGQPPRAEDVHDRRFEAVPGPVSRNFLGLTFSPKRARLSPK